MKEEKLLTIEEVAKLLSKSPRTVRRIVQRGLLNKRRIQTINGLEIRFSEDEVKKLQETMATRRPSSYSQGMDNDHNRDRDNAPHVSGTIDIKDFLQRYETLVAQVGYFRAKSEEIKMLEERTTSLTVQNQSLIEEKKKIEFERDQIVSEKQTLEVQSKTLYETEKRLKRENLVYAIVVIIALIVWFMAAIGFWGALRDRLPNLFGLTG